MNDKLKSCPFCGGEAEVRSFTAALLFVQCKVCLAGTTAFEKSENAVRAWNKRNSMISRLKEKVKTWLKWHLES